MTRRRWDDLRDRYLQTPEQRAEYQAVKDKLDADLAEYYRLRTEHPEWFDGGDLDAVLLRQALHHMDLVDRLNDLLLQSGLILQPMPSDELIEDHPAVTRLHQEWLDRMGSSPGQPVSP